MFVVGDVVCVVVGGDGVYCNGYAAPWLCCCCRRLHVVADYVLYAVVVVVCTSICFVVVVDTDCVVDGCSYCSCCC